MAPGRAEEDSLRRRSVQDDPPALQGGLQQARQQPEPGRQRRGLPVPAGPFASEPPLRLVDVQEHARLRVRWLRAQVEVRGPRRAEVDAPGRGRSEAEGLEALPPLHAQHRERVPLVAARHEEEGDADVPVLGPLGAAPAARVVEHGVVVLHDGPLAREWQRVCQPPASDGAHRRGTARAHGQSSARAVLLQLLRPLVLCTREHHLEALGARGREGHPRVAPVQEPQVSQLVGPQQHGLRALLHAGNLSASLAPPALVAGAGL
mmetsp:Transcript_32294/g.100306  ORF Transcript_32294/g.100306 Transcript_32294/m.100306 type:complete len:263 (-) Transcript_32294:475-1263(-)